MENGKIIRSILNEINQGKTPVHTAYNVTLDMWGEWIEYLDDMNYITAVTIYWYGDDHEYYDEQVHSVDLSKVQLTPFGMRFLAEQMQ